MNATEKTPLRCKLFGHKWTYGNRSHGRGYKFIEVKCLRCGHEDKQELNEAD